MRYDSCKLLMFLFFVILSQLVKSQNNNYEDVVYLKNGSIIRGVLIEQVPNASIKIETKDRSVFFYKIDEIEKLTREIPNNNNNNNNNNQTGEKSKVDVEKEKRPFDIEKMKVKGFTTFIEIANSFKRPFENNYSPGSPNLFGLRVSLGAKINPYLYLGGGLGVETGKRGDIQIIRSFFFPIHSDARVFLLKKRISPFIGQQVGYTFEIRRVDGLVNQNDLTGLFLQTQVGVKANINNDISIIFSIGYRGQQGRNNSRLVTFESGDYYYVFDKKKFNHYPMVSIGMSF